MLKNKTRKDYEIWNEIDPRPMAEKDPRAAAVEPVHRARFFQELEREGFIQKLWLYPRLSAVRSAS